jgi:acyl-CoA synthetase (AMP-forming)/AMP-acid ligase II
MTHTQTETIVEALARHAVVMPAQPAYIDGQGSLSHAELWTAARRRAAWMFRQGVRPGEVVALAFEPDTFSARRAIENLYAVAYLGAVALPLYPEVPQAACVEVMTLLGAQWLVACGAPPRVAQARSVDPRGFEAVPGNFEVDEAPRGDRRDGEALYSFTSGTSGFPKALLFTHAQLHDNCLHNSRASGLQADDRQISAIPWPSLVALRYMICAHVAGGALVAAGVGETREEVALTVQRYHVTRLAVSPWQLRRLLRGPVPATPMPPLRSMLVAGAVVSPEEIRAGCEAFETDVYVGYGCNEVGAITRMPPGDAAPGCVGGPTPGMEVRVEDARGNSLPPGQSGELAFRSPWMCTEYVRNPEATRRHFRNGWFYPGDIGCIDQQGNLWLQGRSVDVINCGGLKIWPEDVEAVLMKHPSIVDAAVAGLPDPMAGQVAAAFVVTSGVLTEQDLRMFCALQMEAGRIPPHIVVVGSIPRNAAGKILRQALVDTYLPAIETSRRRRAGLP